MKILCTKTYNILGPNEQKQSLIMDAAKNIGCHEISFFCFADTCDSDEELNYRMEGIFSSMSNGDTFIMQYPSMVSERYDRFACDFVRRYAGAKLIIWIEDYGTQVAGARYTSFEKEIELFNKADMLIVQSKQMAEHLKENGLKDIPMIEQAVWEFPYNLTRTTDTIERKSVTVNEVSVAKYLDSGISGFVKLTEQPSEYQNSLLSYKLGMCLCMGLPVLVSKDSADAEFVKKYNVGYIYNQESDVETLISGIEEQDLQKKLQNIRNISQILTKGLYSKKTILDTLLTIEEKCIL